MDMKIIKSNIINVQGDAIVLPANEKLKEGPGTSAAIFAAAGRKELTAACKQIGKCEMGFSVPTPAFKLDAKYIIHAVVPKWIDGEHNEYGLLSSAYLSAMKLADIMGCTSIVFSLLASGNNGFDRALALEIAAKSISSFEGEKLKNVILVVYGDNMECFVKSQGYDVDIVESTVKKQPVISDEVKKIIANGLKAAQVWLKDDNNRKKIVDFGFSIAFMVLGKKLSPVNVVREIEKVVK